MRILSNFHDYYDGLSSFDKTDRVYDRRSEEHVINFKREYGKGSGLYDLRWTFHTGNSDWYVNDRKCWRSNIANYGVLGVCGKLYPIMSINMATPKNEFVDDLYFHNLEGLTTFLESQKVRVKLCSGWRVKETPEDMLRLLADNQLLKSFFIKYATPTFYLRFINNDRRDVRAGIIKNQHVLTTNVKLLDYDFQKFKDVYQIYQDIDTYLGNELAVNKNTSNSTGTDVDLARAKGFDKWSFRKDSQK